MSRYFDNMFRRKERQTSAKIDGAASSPRFSKVSAESSCISVVETALSSHGEGSGSFQLPKGGGEGKAGPSSLRAISFAMPNSLADSVLDAVRMPDSNRSLRARLVDSYVY